MWHFLSCSFSVSLECFIISTCHLCKQIKAQLFSLWGKKKIYGALNTCISDSHRSIPTQVDHCWTSPSVHAGEAACRHHHLKTMQFSHICGLVCSPAFRQTPQNPHLDCLASCSCLSATHLQDWHFDIELSEAKQRKSAEIPTHPESAK